MCNRLCPSGAYNIKTMTHPTSHLHKGFTIVETLMAITILMIAIAGHLSIASKGLTGSLASRDQMIGSFLAQESTEVVKNIRDNNLDAGSPWNTGFSSCDNVASSHHCDASAIDPVTIAATGLATYPLRTTSGNYYTHDTSGTLSVFSRYFYVSQPGSSAACLSSDIECTLTAVVDWTEGGVPYEVLLSTEIINSSR